MQREWECEECGYVYTGERPPRRCPECGTDDSFLSLFGEEEEED